MIMERFKISVRVEKRDFVFDAERSDDDVSGFANGYTFFTQKPKIAMSNPTGIRWVFCSIYRSLLDAHSLSQTAMRCLCAMHRTIPYHHVVIMNAILRRAQ